MIGTSKTDIGIRSRVSVSTLIVAVPNCLVSVSLPASTEILMHSMCWGDIISFLASWSDMKDHWIPSSNSTFASTRMPLL